MIPVWILYLLFLAFIGLVFIFAFFNIYHLLRFGRSVFTTVLFTLLYLLTVFLLAGYALVLLLSSDWSDSIDLGFTLNSALPFFGISE